MKCYGISKASLFPSIFFPSLSLRIWPWKLSNPVKKTPDNLEKVCGLGLWEISLRIHHQITVSNGNDSRNVKGPEGRRRVKNLHSRAHYLNIQDYAGGLGHKVLTQELPLGKVFSSSERHSLTTQIEKEKPTLGVTAPSCSEFSGHRQAYDEMKMLTCLRGWSPRILHGNLREALPYVGTGCFLFEFALLSPPYDFLRAMAWGCSQLLLADSGNLNRERFLQRFCRLTPEKVFLEDIDAVCVRTATCHMYIFSSALVHFSLTSAALILSSVNAGGCRDVGVGGTLGTHMA